MSDQLRRNEIQRIAGILMRLPGWDGGGRGNTLALLLREAPGGDRLGQTIDWSGSPAASATAALLAIEKAGTARGGRTYFSHFLEALADQALDEGDQKFLRALAGGASTEEATQTAVAITTRGIEPAELAQRLEKRLNRSELASLWFQLFGSLVSDDLPNAPLSDMAIGLVHRAGQRGTTDTLVDAVRRAYPHVFERPL